LTDIDASLEDACKLDLLRRRSQSESERNDEEPRDNFANAFLTRYRFLTASSLIISRYSDEKSGVITIENSDKKVAFGSGVSSCL